MSMPTSNWSAQAFRRAFQKTLTNVFRPRGVSTLRRRSRRPGQQISLESLELRQMLSVSTVTTNADSGAGSLRQAILNANATSANDEIVFDASLFTNGSSTISLGSALPSIAATSGAGSLSITGPGASSLTIDANQGNFSIFTIKAAGNLTISGVTVSGANTGYGAGFFNNGILTVNNSTISGNTATGSGGGIANYGTLTVSSSTLSGNSASFGGGIWNSGTLTISDSTISGNSASGFGGGINNYKCYANTISVSNSTISNNSATNGGGGIANTNSNLTVSNSTLFGNTTPGNGGGILNATVITGSSNLTVTNSTLSGNSALSGGGIQNNATINNLANTIIANSLSGGDFAGNAPNTNTNNLVETLGTVTGTFIPAFTADPHLGPLRDNSGPTFTMALGAGSPAIGTAAGTGTDQRGINRTTNDIGAYSFGIQVTSTADSGIGSLRTAITQARSTPGNDQISVNLTGANPYTITLATSLRINDANTPITGATAGTVTIAGLGASNLTISGNSGNFSIFAVDAGGDLTISGVTVSGANASSGNGGAFNNQGTLAVSSSTISGNSASFGGGIWNSGTLTVSDSTISGNSATQNGGGIYNNSSGVLNISNSEISGNSASYGGGILTRGNLDISNSKLSANIANDGNGRGSGGGIRNEGALTILNSTLSSNTAYSGGGLSNGSSLTISNSTFFDNSATFGGGIENFGGTFSLNNSTLSGNSAIQGVGRGGAIYNRGVGTISSSTLSGNSAIQPGGGIYNFTGSTLSIANTIIANSTSGGDYAGSGTVNLIGSATAANNLVTQTGLLVSAWATTKTSSQINLGLLQNNGGLTSTMALGAGSAAISTTLLVTPDLDQRGFARINNDIGSYAYIAPSAVNDVFVSVNTSGQVGLFLSSSGTLLSDVHTSFNSLNNTLTITAATLGTLLVYPSAGIPGISVINGSTDSITLDLNTLVNFAGLVIVGNSGTDSITIGTGGVDLSSVTTGALNQSFTANILGSSNSTSALVLTNAIKTKGTAATYVSAGTIDGSGLITTPSITMVALSGIGSTTALNLASQAIAADSSNGKIIINNTSPLAVTVSSLTTKETTNEYDPSPPSYPQVTLIKFNQTGGGDVNLTNVSTIGTTYPAAGEIELSNDGNLTVGAGGVVSDGASNIYIQTTSLGNIILNGNVDASRGDGAISLKSAGSISGTGALVSGSSGRLDDLTAGTGIDVKTQGLDFSAANISTATGNITIENTTSINLPAIAAPANLSIKAGGTISQNGAITVVGTASFHAANGAIGLINIGNDFNSAVSLTNTGANNVAVVDIDDITIDVTSLGTGTFAVTGSSIKLNNNVTTTNKSQTFTGDVVVNANSGGLALVLSAGSGAISITGDIDSATGQNYSLTLTSTGDVIIGGTTGGNQALGTLLITGNDISLGTIGGANVGTTSNVSVQASDGADNGSITLTGTTYNTTGQQFYNSSAVASAFDATRLITLTGGSASTTVSLTSATGIETFGTIQLNNQVLSLNTSSGSSGFVTNDSKLSSLQVFEGPGSVVIDTGNFGQININGAIGTSGTPLSSLTVTNSANANFTGSIKVNTITITDTTDGGFVRFLGNLAVSTGMTVSPNGAFNAEILELSNIAGETTFGNSGSLTLGNAGSDVFNFTGGVIATNPSAINLIGTITAAGIGIITLGDSDTAINIKSASGFVGGASTGTVTLGNAILENGVTLTVGTGIANVINMAAVTGTAGGTAESLTVNTTGAVMFAGAVGTDIGNLTITNSGGTAFQSTVDTATTTITNTTGTVAFQGNLTLGTALVTTAQAYNVSITGASNNIAGATSFLNTGTMALGDAPGDSTTFAGGLVITAPSAIAIQGTVATTNTTMTLGDANTVITNSGTFSNPAILNAGAGIINLAGNVTGNGSNNPLKVITSGVGFTTVSGVNTAELQLSSGVVTIANPSDQTGGYRVSGGTLQGGSMAKVGYIFAQTGTSVLAPGVNSPEMMHTNFLLLSSGNTVQIDLQGITAATGYDQIVVCKSGSVDLANATLALTSTITPASGTVFTIIDNQDNAIPITGTFSGLAEGAVITLNGSTYQISYVGGTGNNDVTLTAANTPTFGTPTATADGFTVQISNYNGNFTYGGAATAGGTVTISNTGVVTVRGVAANTSSTATITTTRNGYANGSSQVTETSLKAANTPAFGTPTATADGYTVQISNYDANFTYGGTATAGGTVAISNTGLVTVSGVAANTSSTATITTIRAGYVNGSAQVTAISVNPADRPTISSAATLKGGKVGRPYVMTYATLRAALKVARGVSIVIQSVQSGAVQKWSGTAWVTVSTAANAPLTQRSVSAGDKIRWLPPAGVSGNRPAFRANAWNGSLYSAVTAQVTIKLTRMAWFRT